MIIRSPRADRFLVIGNDVLRDKRLSFRARGILAYLLSMPDNWQTSSERIAAETTEGRDSIRTALRELQTAGYIHRRRYQDEAGKWRSELLVWDRPSLDPVNNPGENPEPFPQPKTDFQASVFQAIKETPRKNDLGRKSDNGFGSSNRICGKCDGTTWSPGPTGKLSKCDCGDGFR